MNEVTQEQKDHFWKVYEARKHEAEELFHKQAELGAAGIELALNTYPELAFVYSVAGFQPIGELVHLGILLALEDSNGPA